MLAWWARQGSNLRPIGYEPSALPLSYGPSCAASRKRDDQGGTTIVAVGDAGGKEAGRFVEPSGQGRYQKQRQDTVCYNTARFRPPHP